VLFDVRTVPGDEGPVVRVVGDVDLSTMPSLMTQLDAAIAELAAGERVELDLRAVDLFSPLAFGVVIASAMRARRRGGELAVRCGDGRPRELFAESGVDQIVTVAD
jgi:anti-anti-sigma factor